MIITTNPYRTESGAYIREIMLCWLGRRVWIFGLIVALCVILAATIDTAFLFVAVISLFIIFPIVVTFVYFNYAVTVKATRWRRARKVKVTPRELVVEYLDEPDIIGRTPQPEVYPLTSVSGIKPGKKYDTVYFSKAPDDFIIISPEAFPETGSDADSSPRAQFHALMYSVIQRNSLSLQS